MFAQHLSHYKYQDVFTGMIFTNALTDFRTQSYIKGFYAPALQPEVIRRLKLMRYSEEECREFQEYMDFYNDDSNNSSFQIRQPYDDEFMAPVRQWLVTQGR